MGGMGGMGMGGGMGGPGGMDFEKVISPHLSRNCITHCSLDDGTDECWWRRIWGNARF